MSEPITYVGIDAHKAQLQVAVLAPDAAEPTIWTVRNEVRAVNRHRSVQAFGVGVLVRAARMPAASVWPVLCSRHACPLGTLGGRGGPADERRTGGGTEGAGAPQH